PFAGGDLPVWRISMVPGNAHHLAAELGPAFAVFYDWQGGRVWVQGREMLSSDGLRGLLAGPGGGHASLVRRSATAGDTGRAGRPASPAVRELSRRIKQKFDPSGVFSIENWGG